MGEPAGPAGSRRDMKTMHALVPAAGDGTRFVGRSSKLFVLVAGRPILGWTLDALLSSSSVASVTVAISARRFAEESEALTRDRSDRRLRFVEGGAERQESVERCLAGCPAAAEDLVMVHDGARPCLAGEDLEGVVASARRHGAAVLGRTVTDTLKRVREGWIEATVDRSGLFRAETPQVARRRDLERALGEARAESRQATDESGLLELAGVPVRAVEARFANPKLTVPADLELIEPILRRRSVSEREAG